MNTRLPHRILSILFIGIYLLASSPRVLAAKAYTERQLRNMNIQFVEPGEGTQTCSVNPDIGRSAIPPSSKIFYLGDSLTYGMVKAGGLLEKTQAAGFTVDIAPTVASGATPIPPYAVGGAYGKNVSATGGITIGDSSRLAVDYSAVDIGQAGAIIIALGTNAKAEAKANIEADRSKPTSQISDADVATAQAQEIPKLIAKLRSINETAPIFWVNTYASNPAYANSVTVNQTIAAQSQGKYTVIDIAAAIDAGEAPKPDGGDSGGSIHYAPATYGTRAQWLVDQLKEYSQSVTAGLTMTESGGFNPLSLLYPAFPDEALIASNIQNYIQTKTPSSPWLTIPNIGQWIMSEAKARNINPMIVMGLGRQENNFGTVGNNAKNNNNYFGVKGPHGYVHYDSPLAGMTAFLNALENNIVKKNHPSYKEVTSFYEYVSVHQTGGIHYPGDGMNIYDSAMNVYVSWDTQYNPRNYWSTVAGVISDLTGTTISPEIPARGTTTAVSVCGSTPTTDANGNPPAGAGASQYVTDCEANGGNAAIACTAVNQLSGIAYDAVKRAGPTDTNPAFLDCSALVGMAIYRTFGVNLEGLCSVSYKTDSHFEEIALSDIKPGDMVGWGTVCGSSAHIAIVASYNPTTDDLVIMQASSPKTLSGTKSEKLKDSEFTWAVRYIGQKTLQPGAL